MILLLETGVSLVLSWLSKKHVGELISPKNWNMSLSITICGNSNFFKKVVGAYTQKQWSTWCDSCQKEILICHALYDLAMPCVTCSVKEICYWVPSIHILCEYIACSSIEMAQHQPVKSNKMYQSALPAMLKYLPNKAQHGDPLLTFNNDLQNLTLHHKLFILLRQGWKSVRRWTGMWIYSWCLVKISVIFWTNYICT